MTHPDPEAYERVTNPERFAILHTVADQLIDDLEATYQVERQEVVDVLEGPGVQRQLRLTPVEGAPLTIGFTRFPGLLVRMGHWYEVAFPPCGCDACDEQPAEVVQDLRSQVEAVVGGGLSEALDRRWWRRPSRSYILRSGWGRSEGLEPLPRAEARRMTPVGAVRWGPWPRR